MKGVVVQVGEPKSIVLLNSGKIISIPTPQEAHVGMEITVRLSRKVKILSAFAIFALTAALVAGVAIFHSHLENQKDKTYTEMKENYSYKKGVEKNFENGNGRNFDSEEN